MRPWTPVEDQYLLDHVTKTTNLAIGRSLGRSRDAVQKRLQLLDKKGVVLPWRKKGPPPGTDAIEPVRVVDGYDDVPYWMRQAYRPQGMPLVL